MRVQAAGGEDGDAECADLWSGVLNPMLFWTVFVVLVERLDVAS